MHSLKRHQTYKTNIKVDFSFNEPLVGNLSEHEHTELLQFYINYQLNI